MKKLTDFQKKSIAVIITLFIIAGTIFITTSIYKTKVNNSIKALYDVEMVDLKKDEKKLLCSQQGNLKTVYIGGDRVYKELELMLKGDIIDKQIDDLLDTVSMTKSSILDSLGSYDLEYPLYKKDDDIEFKFGNLYVKSLKGLYNGLVRIESGYENDNIYNKDTITTDFEYISGHLKALHYLYQMNKQICN